MARKTPPSFDFYPDDFVGGTAHMTAEQVGMYWRSICFQWGHGLLPNNVEMLQQITGVWGEKFAKSWPVVAQKFVLTDDGMMFNERLKAVRDKALAVSEARAKAGRKGGSKQNGSKTEAKTKQMGRGKREVGSSNKSKKVESLPIDKRIDTPQFREAWQLWIRHRKQKRCPLTESSAELQLSEFAEMGEVRAIAAIRHSVKMGWQGLFEPTPNGKQEPKQIRVEDLH